METVIIVNKRSTGSALYVSIISIVAAIGGFLFGFDTAVISGALRSLITYFQVENSPVLQGWLGKEIILGSVFGAGLSGWLTDKFGRKNILILTAFLFLTSAIGSSIASSFTFFFFSRFIAGIFVGHCRNGGAFIYFRGVATTNTGSYGKHVPVCYYIWRSGSLFFKRLFKKTGNRNYRNSKTGECYILGVERYMEGNVEL